MASRSPTITTPLPKTSSAPDTPLRDTAAAPQATAFPPPQTFDIIPPLHGLLLRLLSSQTSHEVTSSGGIRVTGDAAEAAAHSGPSSTVPTQSQTQQQQSSTTSGAGNNNNGSAQVLPSGVSVPRPAGSASVTAEIAALGSNAPPPLDVKALPIETNSIKIRIQKARAVVDSLPDVHRSVAEQEREIEELEDRIARLRSVISEFGRRAGTENLEAMETHGS